MSNACYENIPTNAIEKLNSLITQGDNIGMIAFTPNNSGWVIVKDQNGAYGHNLPHLLVNRIKTRTSATRLGYQHDCVRA